jgi:hypothetical protein
MSNLNFFSNTDGIENRIKAKMDRKILDIDASRMADVSANITLITAATSSMKVIPAKMK